MIYGIAGASGTGKTTLGHQVGEALSIPFVRTSITAMAEKAGFKAVGSLSLPDRLELQESLLEQFGDLLDKTKGPIIFDRTPIDLIGYLGAEVHMHSNRDLDTDDLIQIDDYYTRCQQMTAQYFDRTFITSILPEYELAATRPDFNPAYQRHVHMLIIGAAVSAEVPLELTILVTDSLQDRVQIVSDAIADRLEEIEKHKRESRFIH